MPFDASSLKEYIYSSERQAHFMQKYCDLFNSIFSNEVVSFGYEKWNTAGFHLGLSNAPRMAELYIETGAPEDQNVIIHPHNTTAICTFVQHDPDNFNDKYNYYRQELENHFSIRTTFCIIEKHLDECQAFIWNFKIPKANITINQEQIIIMHDMVNKAALLKHGLDKFKHELSPIIKQEEVYMVNVDNISPSYKDTKHYHDEDSDYRIRMNLLCKFNAIREHLNINVLDLLTKESLCLELYLKNLKLQEIAENTTISTTDIKLALYNVGLKLDALIEHPHIKEKITQLKEIGIII